MSIHGAPLPDLFPSWPASTTAAAVPKATALTTGTDFQSKSPKASPARSIADGCTEVVAGDNAATVTPGTALPMVARGTFLRDMAKILR